MSSGNRRPWCRRCAGASNNTHAKGKDTLHKVSGVHTRLKNVRHAMQQQPVSALSRRHRPQHLRQVHRPAAGQHLAHRLRNARQCTAVSPKAPTWLDCGTTSLVCIPCSNRIVLVLKPCQATTADAVCSPSSTMSRNGQVSVRRRVCWHAPCKLMLMTSCKPAPWCAPRASRRA